VHAAKLDAQSCPIRLAGAAGFEDMLDEKIAKDIGWPGLG
jgi:hypothetical protein